MKTLANRTRSVHGLSWAVGLASAAIIFSSLGADASKISATAVGRLVPLELKLPATTFPGTPKDVPISPYTEPYDPKKKRPPMLVPPGLTNLATRAKITCSDKNATPDALAKLVDGDAEAAEQSIIYLRKGSQWVQMDFGEPKELFAAVVWHAHNAFKVYHAVVVQVADDQDFIQNLRTLFNNDQENASGLGIGTDREYFETNEGKLIDLKGVKARYIRFCSKGSTESTLNEYTELMVFGRAPGNP